MGFLITNSTAPLNSNKLKIVKKINANNIYVSEGVSVLEDENLTILLSGYVLPRQGIDTPFAGAEFINVLYRKYGVSFIEYVKGIFTIIIAEKESVHIFNDHFGLSYFYFCQAKGLTHLSDSAKLIQDYKGALTLDTESLAINALLHKVEPGYTVFKGLKRSLPATHISIINEIVREGQYWKPDDLLQDANQPDHSLTIEYFASLIRTNFSDFEKYLHPENHTITLTGGKDSRTGLAALESNGISPEGFTYGNPGSRDAVYAAKLAKELKIPHYIFSAPDTPDYFETISHEILNVGGPDINLHRAHRLYAFKQMAAKLNGDSAYYGGYMAGEFLMGVYYDNLIFTNFLTHFWETSENLPVETRLDQYFLNPEAVDIQKTKDRISQLKTFDSALGLKERQFYGMFEIGIPHHGQDILLSKRYLKYTYPFFIDIDFLVNLFKSRYSFFFTDNKTINLLNRYKLFEFNLNIQHKLYPGMDSVPFGKRGSYNTREFLNGKFYWAFIKGIRYFVERQQYPVTYNYGQSYRDFLSTHLNELYLDRSHILHQYFDIDKAVDALKLMDGNYGEEKMRRFTNIVQLYMLINGRKTN